MRRSGLLLFRARPRQQGVAARFLCGKPGLPGVALVGDQVALDAPQRWGGGQEVLRTLLWCEAAPQSLFCGIDEVLRRRESSPEASGVFRPRNYGEAVGAERGVSSGFAVGTVITHRPPHRSVQAGFPHTAPTSGV